MPGMSDVAAPGSPEARAAGCICPRYDNHHGLGYMGCPGRWVMRLDCPVHGEPATEMPQTREEADNA